MHLYEVTFNGTCESVAGPIPVYAPPGDQPRGSHAQDAAAQIQGPTSSLTEASPRASGAYASDFLDRMLALRRSAEDGAQTLSGPVTRPLALKRSSEAAGPRGHRRSCAV